MAFDNDIQLRLVLDATQTSQALKQTSDDAKKLQMEIAGVNNAFAKSATEAANVDKALKGIKTPEFELRIPKTAVEELDALNKMLLELQARASEIRQQQSLGLATDKDVAELQELEREIARLQAELAPAPQRKLIDAAETVTEVQQVGGSIEQLTRQSAELGTRWDEINERIQANKSIGIDTTKDKAELDAVENQILAIDTEINKLSTGKTPIKGSDIIDVDGVAADINRLKADIKELEQVSREALKAGDTTNWKEAELEIGRLKQQLTELNSVQKQGRQEWKETGKEQDKALEGGTKGLANMGKEFIKGITGANTLGSAFMKLGSALGAAVSIKALIDLTKEAVEAGNRQLQFEAKLGSILNDNTAAVERYALAASRLATTTLFPKNTIEDAITFAAAQNRSEAETNKLLDAAAGLATVTGRDLKTAMMQLDMTYEGSIGRLGRLDGRLKELSKSELQNGAAVDLLAEKYRGVAESAAQAGTGAFTLAKKKTEELKEAWGKTIIQGGLLQGIMRGYSKIVDAIVPNEKALSDTYRDQQMQVNTLAAQLSSVNISREEQLKLIGQINSIYPKLLEGQDEENINYDKLKKSLAEYNSQMERLVLLKINEEKITEIGNIYKSKMTEIDEVTRKLNKNIQETFWSTSETLKQGIDKTLTDPSKAFIEKITSFYRDVQIANRRYNEQVAIDGKVLGALWAKYGGVENVRELASKYEIITDLMVGSLKDARSEGVKELSTWSTVIGGSVSKGVAEGINLLNVTSKAALANYKASTDELKKFMSYSGKELSELEQDLLTPPKAVTLATYDDLTKNITEATKALENYRTQQIRANELRNSSTALTTAEINELKLLDEALALTTEAQLERELNLLVAKEKKIKVDKGSKDAIDKEKTAYEKLGSAIETLTKQYENLIFTKKQDTQEAQDLKAKLDAKKLEYEAVKENIEILQKYGKTNAEILSTIRAEFKTLKGSKDLELKLDINWADPSKLETLKNELQQTTEDAQKLFNDNKISFDEFLSITAPLDNMILKLREFLSTATGDVSSVGKSLQSENEKTTEQFIADWQKAFDKLQLEKETVSNIPVTIKQEVKIDKSEIDLRKETSEVLGLTDMLSIPAQNVEVPLNLTPFEKSKAEQEEKRKIEIAKLMKSLGLVVEEEAAKMDFNIWEDLFGIDDEATQESLNKSLSLISDGLTSLVEQYVESTEQIVENYNRLIDEQQAALDTELELMEQGEANSVNLEKQKLAQLKQERDKAIKDQQAAAKLSIAVDTAQQASSLATAAANVFNSQSPLGLPGIAIAIGAIALMFATFMKFKLQAKESAMFREGGSVLLKGRRHAEGGIKVPDANIEVEGGESMHILRREAVPKYFNIINKIIEHANRGTLSVEDNNRKHFMGEYIYQKLIPASEIIKITNKDSHHAVDRLLQTKSLSEESKLIVERIFNERDIKNSEYRLEKLLQYKERVQSFETIKMIPTLLAQQSINEIRNHITTEKVNNLQVSLKEVKDIKAIRRMMEREDVSVNYDNGVKTERRGRVTIRTR
jgi:hypothetical protein